MSTTDLTELQSRTKRNKVTLMNDIKHGKLKGTKIDNKWIIECADADRFCAALVFDNLHKRKRYC